MTVPLARDHHRRRRAEPVPLNEQFRCEVCGGYWFTAETLARHRDVEAEANAPAMIAEAKQKQAAYEASRWRHREMYPTGATYQPFRRMAYTRGF